MESGDRLLEFWRKRDPFLTDLDGFERLVERVQRFQELHSQVTVWRGWGEEGWGPKETKKYRGISAIIAHEAKNQPNRFCGLAYHPVNDLLTFEEAKTKIEKRGDRFVCFEVMHEEILDHDPERPHIKGTFCKHDYYDYDWEPIEKPEILKKIERHLRRVSNWYNRGEIREGEPYPTPPLWVDEP